MGRIPRAVGSAVGVLALVLVLAACATGGGTPAVTPGVSPAERTGATASPAAATSTTASSSTTSAGAGRGVDDAFRARADAACRPYSDYNTAHPFPFTGFDPDHPDPALLPQIGDFFDRNPSNHTLVPTLVALGEPARGGDEWHALLDTIGREARLATEQIAAARATDTQGFVANVAQSRQQFAGVNQAFAAAGFAIAVDFCAALYGG